MGCMEKEVVTAFAREWHGGKSPRRESLTITKVPPAATMPAPTHLDLPFIPTSTLPWKDQKTSASDRGAGALLIGGFLEGVCWGGA